MNTDRIEKSIELRAPVSRVWRALTDHTEFNAWFRVDLKDPFVPGRVSRGNITYPGYEDTLMEVRVKEMQPERLFSFEWQGDDQTPDVWTLVEFELSPTASGTLLRVTESGFDRLPPERREERFRQNDQGWAEQMTNIERHVAAA